jgi:glycosyltransferase involved in cell wall biosynthesis
MRRTHPAALGACPKQQDRTYMAMAVLEMEKLRVLESGLGQFCAHLGRELAGLERGPLELEFLVPKSCVGFFGRSFRYRTPQVWHRMLGIPAKDCGVWHAVHQDAPYLPAGSKARILLTIHDLDFLVKWQGHQGAIRRRLKRLQRLVDRAAVITAVSHFTEKVAQSHLRCRAPIEVIYNGNCLQSGLVPERPAAAPNGQFLLALGQVNRRKNFHVLLPLLRAEPSWNLVLAGIDDNEYGRAIRVRARRAGLQERVAFTGPVSEAEKLWLYQNCEAFLFPSLTEGFGMPAVEAMSQGKPVFLSREGSLPEVGGPEAYYWDDFSAETVVATFLEGMEAFHNDPEKTERLRAWSKRFAWRQAAERYLELYHELAA